MMGQLHELLAVEGDLRNKASLILGETVKTFTSKTDHFDGLDKIYTPDREDGEKIPPESKRIATTVAEKVHYTEETLSEALNAQLSKEETNCSGKACADLEVDGVKFGSFSATSLLALEQFFNKVRDAWRMIPTLDPTRTWNKNAQRDANIFFSDKETKYRVVKELTKFEKAAATDKFAAQVDIIQLERQVGHYETEYSSGRLTPAQKAQLLNRVDHLIDAVKKTRAKANQAEVTQISVANKFFAYLDKDIV
jgi:hypothetical protein